MVGLKSLWALEGNWRLEREIAHADGSVNQLTGTTRFQRSGQRLVQDEAGTLTLGNQEVKATRRYIWAAADRRLDVFFDDMRSFHTVFLGVARHETVHLCDPDRYAVSYDFTDWPNWTTHWQVEGPRKNYVMTSWYTPA
jgi:hypothetical protein